MQRSRHEMRGSWSWRTRADASRTAEDALATVQRLKHRLDEQDASDKEASSSDKEAQPLIGEMDRRSNICTCPEVVHGVCCVMMACCAMVILALLAVAMALATSAGATRTTKHTMTPT